MSRLLPSERPRRWLILSIAAATVLSVSVMFGHLARLHVSQSLADSLDSDDVPPAAR